MLPPAVGRTFKRMQTELGLWHDQVVLAERAMQESLDARLACHDPRLAARVLRLAESALRAAEARLRRFTVLWQGQGPELANVIGAHVKPQAVAAEPATPIPSEVKITGTERDPGPGGSREIPGPAAPPTGAPSAA
jgi:hypothetical protein